MDYNYFVYECPHLSSYYESAKVEKGLYNAALNKDEYFTFYIEDALNFDDSLTALFDDPQYFFDFTYNVNERLSDYEIDESNIYYYYDEALRYITVELNYY